MLPPALRIMVSVRSRLFFGFCALSMIIMCLGSYAVFSISNSGNVLKDTFDRPIQEINFSRSAGQTFKDIKIKGLEAQAGTTEVQSVFNAEITEMLTRFEGDIHLARDKSISTEALPLYDQVIELTKEWKERIAYADETTAAVSHEVDLGPLIQTRLQTITELQTDNSFKYRVWALDQIALAKTDLLVAASIALVLTAIISGWVGLTIIRPLRSAAVIAREISAGNLEVNIPIGGEDETGAFLNTMAAMQTNIRTRMSKEQNLRAVAQTRLAESLENSKDAILLADCDGKIIVANQQFQALFPSFGSEDLSEKRYIDFFEENGVPKHIPSQYFEEDQEISFEDGSWVRINASNTKEGGRLIIWTDITQAKERNERLLIAKEQAEAAAKSRTLFLAAMSHELRTPLNAVIGFSQIIHSEALGKISNKRYLEMAMLISQSGEHLLNIVKDVLSIANGEGSSKNIEDMTPVNLADIVRYCVNTSAGDAKEKSIRIVCEQELPEATIMGDRQALRQTLLNVLSNAIKFNHPGGAVMVNLDIGHNGTIRIDVIDNGIGIDADDLQRIQDPFVQVDNGFTRKYEGAGLGLSIVKQSVAAHGGKVLLASKLKKGTRVSLIFPLLNIKGVMPKQHAA